MCHIAYFSNLDYTTRLLMSAIVLMEIADISFERCTDFAHIDFYAVFICHLPISTRKSQIMFVCLHLCIHANGDFFLKLS